MWNRKNVEEITYIGCFSNQKPTTANCDARSVGKAVCRLRTSELEVSWSHLSSNLCTSLSIARATAKRELNALRRPLRRLPFIEAARRKTGEPPELCVRRDAPVSPFSPASAGWINGTAQRSGGVNAVNVSASDAPGMSIRGASDKNTNAV